MLNRDDRPCRRWRFVAAVVAIALTTTADARTLLTQQQALAAAFPADTQVTRQTFFLSKDEMEGARRRSSVEISGAMVVRYKGMIPSGELAGWAYFDSHRVRTLNEAVMIVVTPAGTIEKVEILSFNEPMDYFPRPRWLDQFRRRNLDDELSLNRAIRPITGASLTARAILSASRRVLAIHQTIEARSGPSAAAP